ncbi:integrase [Paraburkholderia panacisoli]|uniref:Integrase n=1 Tax=Paraburkholderia panacisoli TaxID=2603818 RepID=A0A5B0HHZ1_9BURK|nr:integrase [Paraburkholderia panacisoli]KAA1014929.1 integrase [Paraburkholderia panacisoli]
MAEIVTFVPRVELDAEENLAGFVELSKTQLTVFGASLDFSQDVWDITGSVEAKARYHRIRLPFSNLDTSHRRGKHDVMMAEPFLSFAKSYIRYQQGMRPTINISFRLTALRAIEAALRESGTANPVHIDSGILNRAVQLLKSLPGRFAPSTLNLVAGQLQILADFLQANRLTSTLAGWHNPTKKPDDFRVKVGKEFDDRRSQKLPSEAALNALPKVFLLATLPSDVLVSSLAAVLCSAPDRINECLLLPEKCEVRQKNPKNGVESYGLRWWPAKGAAPMVKWVIASMADVVTKAVGRIRQMTQEAREVAAWYEKNPNKIYLPDSLKALRSSEWLSMEELSEVLFAEPVDRNTASQWCHANGIELEVRNRRGYVRFADVQASVLKELPPGFPVLSAQTGLRYREALCVVQRNQLHAAKARFRCIIEPISQFAIYNRLGARSSSGIQSIFDRCGFFEPDGSAIRVSSHQFRHYLNTLAQAGGMSQLDIAKWSGRKDVRQNEYYDQQSTESLLARVRTAVGDDTRLFGPLSVAPRAVLISRDEFARLKVPTAHTTDFGYCIHDYVMSPCQMHRDCLNCEEQVCIKGETEKEQRIRQAYAEATRLLTMAVQAERDGDFGASEWVEHHQLHVARLAGILEILDNPSVARGAIIQPAPANRPSRIDQATEFRQALPTAVRQTGVLQPLANDEVSV